MKKIFSISLSVFLIMGAVVLFTGVSANADQISNAFYGNWSCNAVNPDDPNTDFVRQEIIQYMNIARDGTTTSLFWMLYQLEGDWVGGASYTGTGSIVDETYPTIGISGSGTYNGSTFTMSGRCIGKEFDQNNNSFGRATCIQAIVWDNMTDYIENWECFRTVKPR